MPTSSSLLIHHHPDYDRVFPDYVVMDDTYEGERAVKAARYTYLPATAGMILDGALQDPNGPAAARYESYLQRAVFPEYVGLAVQTLVGVLNREPAKIQLPAAMEPLRSKATRRGESLDVLLRRVHENILRKGRLALLADSVRGAPTPILVDYAAERLVNWDDEPEDTLEPNRLRMAVLDESRPELTDGFTWTNVLRGRALLLTDDTNPDFELPTAVARGDREPSESATYRTVTDVEGTRGPVVEPTFNGRALPFIPLTVVGSTDLALSPGPLPLIDLARTCLTIYRGEADYRTHLHLQGQDTLVIEGQEGSSDDEDEAEAEDDVRVGAGSVIYVPVGGSANFISVDANGLAEHRATIAADRTLAQERGARLLHPPGSQAESGEALRIRIGAATASLQSIALTAAAGLQTALRQIAEWMGLDPSGVIVEPNLTFAEVRPEPRSLGDLMDAKAKGAPISLQSVHRYAQEGDFTVMTYEDELDAIAEEEPLVEPAPAPGAAPGTTPGMDPDEADPAEDPDVPEDEAE